MHQPLSPVEPGLLHDDYASSVFASGDSYDGPPEHPGELLQGT